MPSKRYSFDSRVSLLALWQRYPLSRPTCAHQCPGGTLTVSSSRSRSRYRTGSTKRVSSVLDMRPPITTVANGFCTSAPVPVARAMGMNPKEATSAVISTGRNRVTAPLQYRIIR